MSNHMILGLLGVLLLLSVVHSISPPVFPDSYQIDFNQTAKLVTKGTTLGKIYIDVKNNRQLIKRDNGNHDRYCGSVFKLVNTKCNHIIVDNKRYLDFPDKQYCCFCCDGAHGCGIIAPDWLVKANATYNGTEKLEDGGVYLKWEIKGLQTNYYYHKDDSLQTPRRLFQVSDDLMDFSNYKVGPIDQSIFKLPNYCTDKCGLTTICAGLRGQKGMVKSAMKEFKDKLIEIW